MPEIAVGDFGEAILTGVIGGLLATAIVLFFGETWSKILRPRIEEMLYRDLSIAGEWMVDAGFSGNDQRKRNLHLKQRAHQVTGTLVATSGSDEGAAYDLDGVFKNLILTLTYVATDKAARDRGTITLIVKEDGRRLEGISSYYSTEADAIRHCTYSCKRKEYASGT